MRISDWSSDVCSSDLSFTGKNLYKKDLDDFVGKAKITVAEEDMEDGDDPQKLGSKAIFQAVRDEMMAGRDALVFVHGYDHTFREAAGRAVQLQQWLAAGGKDMALLLFTWPSAGAGVSARTSADHRDRARLSGPALSPAVLPATHIIHNTACNKR